MKKIFKNTEWTFLGLEDTPFFKEEAFVFRRKQSQDVSLVQQAKLVFQKINVVVHLDATGGRLFNISDSNMSKLSLKNPVLATQLNRLLKVSASERELKSILEALESYDSGRKYKEVIAQYKQEMRKPMRNALVNETASVVEDYVQEHA